MGVPNLFNDIIKKHIDAYSAWLPITNIFRLGDYGMMDNGVFTKIGNIQDDFNLTFTSKAGPESSIDFTSANTTVLKFAAGAKVDVIPEGAIDAKVVYNFEKEKSFLVKSPVITSLEIEDKNALAIKIKKLDDWRRKWRVVYRVYNAQDAVIVSTISGNTEISFSGDVKALQKLNVGNASVNLNVNKEVGLKVQGKAGVIGLGLFKLKIIGGGIDVLREAGPKPKQKENAKQEDLVEVIDPNNDDANDF